MSPQSFGLEDSVIFFFNWFKATKLDLGSPGVLTAYPSILPIGPLDE